MGFIAIDEIAEIAGQCRPYTDGGTGYEPRANYHIKWHSMPGYPLVVDRFHVTYELDGSKVYYLISRRGLKYTNHAGGEVTRDVYDRLGNLLKTFDSLALDFLAAIKHKIGDSRSGITKEVTQRRQAAAAMQAKSQEWLKVYDQVQALRRRYIDQGVPEHNLWEPKKSEFRECKTPEELAALAESYTVRFEQVKHGKHAAPPTPPGYEVVPGVPAIVATIRDDGEPGHGTGAEHETKRRRPDNE
jgi:hypothetical protein